MTDLESIGFEPYERSGHGSVSKRVHDEAAAFLESGLPAMARTYASERECASDVQRYRNAVSRWQRRRPRSLDDGSPWEWDKFAGVRVRKDGLRMIVERIG